MILEQTVELIQKTYDILNVIPPKVTKVVIGLGYTGVELTTDAHEQFLGLASTLPSIIRYTDCSKIEFAGKLTNKSLLELMKWSFNPPSIKKIIGIATTNGLSQHLLKIRNQYNRVKGDLLRHLNINKDLQLVQRKIKIYKKKVVTLLLLDILAHLFPIYSI